MAQYTSRFPKLAFYVNGEQKRFDNGVYNTDKKEEIAVLDVLKDAQRVDEPKAQPQPKTETKTEAPATKPSARKGTASAK